MESLSQYYTRLSQESKINKQAYEKLAELSKDSKVYIVTFKMPAPMTIPETVPIEPWIKEIPSPKPSTDDPFNVPAPLVDPTPKGLL